MSLNYKTDLTAGWRSNPMATEANSELELELIEASNDAVLPDVSTSGAGCSRRLLDARLEVLRNSQRESFPYRVRAARVDLEIREGVFSPKYFESSEAFCSMLQFRKGETFLDIGTGSGIAAILAAQHGANRILATDILDSAVSNADANIARLGFSGLIEVRQSNVFEAISAGEKFDTVFWNTPWVWAPKDYRWTDPSEAAVCDPGYGAISRFLEDVRLFVASRGRIVIGTGSFARLDLLHQLLLKHGFRARTHAVRRSVRHPEFEFRLLALEPVARHLL